MKGKWRGKEKDRGRGESGGRGGGKQVGVNGEGKHTSPQVLCMYVYGNS